IGGGPVGRGAATLLGREFASRAAAAPRPSGLSRPHLHEEVGRSPQGPGGRCGLGSGRRATARRAQSRPASVGLGAGLSVEESPVAPLAPLPAAPDPTAGVRRAPRALPRPPPAPPHPPPPH